MHSRLVFSIECDLKQRKSRLNALCRDGSENNKQQQAMKFSYIVLFVVGKLSSIKNVFHLLKKKLMCKADLWLGKLQLLRDNVNIMSIKTQI